MQVFRPQNTQGGQRRQGGRGGQRQTQAGADSRPGANRDRREGSVSAQERGRDNNRPAKDRDGNRPARDFRDRDRQSRDGRDKRDGRDRDSKDKERQGRDFRDRDGRDKDRQNRSQRDGKDKDRQAETSVIATVRAEIIETEGTAMAETETVRDASVTARAEEEETEEITDHPFRPRLWQNRSRKGDPRRIIIRKKEYDRDEEREGKFSQKQGKGKKNQQPVMEKATAEGREKWKEHRIKQSRFRRCSQLRILQMR